MALSSINTGLQQTPDLTDIQSVGKLSFQFISIYNAIGVLQQAIDTYTGNTPVPANNSNQSQPPEQTVIVGNTANMWCKANVTISAGFALGLANVGGVIEAILALASSSPVQCFGLSMTSATAGNPIQVLLLGLFNFGGSVTPGALYYLSPGVGGGLTTTKPTAGSGQLIQPLGYGVDTNSIFFNPSLYTSVA